VTERQFTLEMAKAILATPPTVLDKFVFKARHTWQEYRKVRYEFSGIEFWQAREHSIHGSTDWTCV